MPEINQVTASKYNAADQCTNMMINEYFNQLYIFCTKIYEFK